ncbi:MAG: ABC transporter ATP-binding protein [Bryobacteraceae bacterium]
MPDIAIRTETLTRDFAAVRAVDGLTLQVEAGAVFGFLGPNGSGKTTTIRMLLGLLEPTAGRAEVLGFDTRTHSGQIRARSGALLENPGLYERFSAEDNLEFYARVWHLGSAERRARIRQLLDHLGLWDRRKETVSKWSRGMKQKLAVARALIHRPSLIFLDEPTAGLDPVAAAALRADLQSLVANGGATVFLTTHNLAEAEKLCTHVAVIREGKLLAIGHPDELRAQSGAPKAEILGRGFTPEVLLALRSLPMVASTEVRNGRLIIALRGPSDLAPIVALLVTVGAQIEEVHKGHATLEDVFLKLMEEETA